MINGDFFKLSKDFGDDYIEEQPEQDARPNYAAMSDDDLRAYVMNELSRANESKVDNIFGSIKIHMQLPKELERNFSASYQKIQYIIKALPTLNKEQLIGLANVLTSE